MRRVFVALFGVILSLWAVQWDIEEIPNLSGKHRLFPILTLDNQGYPCILFNEEHSSLNLACNASGEWIVTEVAQGFINDFYSLDIDSAGNIFLAYECVMGEQDPDIFFACDTGGEFVPVNLTNDPGMQTVPIIRLDNEDNPYLLYINVPVDEGELFFGHIDSEGLHAEQIVDNLWPWFYWGYDFCFDADNIPHVLYAGDNEYHLWHAFSDQSHMEWTKEEIHSHDSGWPMVVEDAAGALHVAYEDLLGGRGRIHYLTNHSGAWSDELVSDNAPPAGGNERPSIALDPQGNPHMGFICVDDDWTKDMHYACKSADAWVEEAVTSVPERLEWPGWEHYFAIDDQGYGHLVYHAEDEDTVWQVYYAKSKAPLAVVESPVEAKPFDLEVRGSAVHFSLPEASLIRLDLYDAAGRRVERLASGNYEAGDHSIPINSAELPTGVYFVRAEINGQSASVKFVFTL